MGFWQDRRVVVTGGGGFLGGYVLKGLAGRGCTCVMVPEIDEFDLRPEQDVQRMYTEMRPDLVIHLAATVGGIGANRAHPGTIFYDNLIMGTQLIEFGRRHNLDKFVSIGSVCSYPKYTTPPFKEEDLWKGYPEETNAPYGLSKIMMLVQAQAYRAEFAFNCIHLVMVNLYGPGDDFNPNTSHVIPALIKKCIEARESGADHIEVWGTGKATREFLYVADAAEGILAAAQHYNGDQPVNLGCGNEISIRDLVKLICQYCGFKGSIVWDSSKPDGQPRRGLDTTRARKYFGFEAKTSFREGLKREIEWYEGQCAGTGES